MGYILNSISSAAVSNNLIDHKDESMDEFLQEDFENSEICVLDNLDEQAHNTEVRNLKLSFRLDSIER